jgi:hypothetical protein
MASHRSERIWFQLSCVVGPLVWASQFEPLGIILMRIVSGTYTQCCLLTESEDEKGSGDMQGQNQWDRGFKSHPRRLTNDSESGNATLLAMYRSSRIVPIACFLFCA